MDETNLLRLIAYNYANRLNVLPEDIKKYSSTIDDLLPKTESNYYSRLEETRKFRVVVGTSTTIGQLLESKSLRNNFTHAIIDEAGQSTELGVLVPMALVGSKGQTIMAGDPMQMPPLVMNLHANTRGLSTSMLSRLLDCYEKVENAVSAISFTLVKSKIFFSSQLLVSLLKYFFKADENHRLYDSCLISKLAFNYRSLPSILDFYNSQFYKSELIPMVDAQNSHDAKLLKHISQIFHHSGDYGIWFVNVDHGPNEKRKNSWRNPYEAHVVGY